MSVNLWAKYLLGRGCQSYWGRIILPAGFLRVFAYSFSTPAFSIKRGRGFWSSPSFYFKRRREIALGNLFMDQAQPTESRRKIGLHIHSKVNGSIVNNRFPFNSFKFFGLSFQSSFRLSLAVLVRYRFPIVI